MSSRALASGHNGTRRSPDNAAANSAPELVDSFAAMCEVGKRPRSLKWKLGDAARGKPVRPLGTYPRVAEDVLEAGGNWYRVTRPLYVQLARLRQICFGGKSLPMPERIRVVAKESAESDVAITCLALAGEHASTSDLATADREIREELVEKEMLVEEIERRLYAEKK